MQQGQVVLHNLLLLTEIPEWSNAVVLGALLAVVLVATHVVPAQRRVVVAVDLFVCAFSLGRYHNGNLRSH